MKKFALDTDLLNSAHNKASAFRNKAEALVKKIVASAMKTGNMSS